MGKADRAIAIILKDNSILMWWRYLRGQEFYVFPGGTQELGETIEETLVREVYEELNYKVIRYQKFFEYIHNSEDEDGNIYPRNEFYFLVTEFEGELKLGAPEVYRLSKENIYRPDWINIKDLDKIEYEPKELFEKIKNLPQIYK